jgi:hypothetical protein
MNVCLSAVCFIFCQVEVSASGRSLFQRSPTECGVSEYDHKSSTTRRSWSTWLLRQGKKKGHSQKRAEQEKVVKYGKINGTRSTTWHNQSMRCCIMGEKTIKIQGLRNLRIRVLAVNKMQCTQIKLNKTQNVYFDFLYKFVCVLACARAREYVCLCVCVWERERQRETERERKGERDTFLILKRTERDMIINVYWFPCKVTVNLVRF